MRPSVVHEGLAVYAVDSGEPVLLMPYPHAASVVGSPTLTALIEGLRNLGRKVITFDPPGAGHSTRAMQLDMPEMLRCAEEALILCSVSEPTDVMGHS